MSFIRSIESSLEILSISGSKVDTWPDELACIEHGRYILEKNINVLECRIVGEEV
jgi:hypothetical protein